MKCICDICCCGRHRCPHFMPRPENVKEPCLFTTEYTDEFLSKEQSKRSPYSRPGDQYQIPNEDMEKDTEYSKRYKGDQNGFERTQGKRPMSAARSSNSPFNAITIHQQDYQGNQSSGERTKGQRPMSRLRALDEPFNAITTHQQDYQGDQCGVDRSRGQRPMSRVRTSNEPFDAITTHQQDYQGNHNSFQRSQGKRPSSRVRTSNEPFDAITTNQQDYITHENYGRANMSRSQNERSSEALINRNPFDSKTTNSTTYKKWDIEPRSSQNLRPQSCLGKQGGEFNTDTSYNTNYIKHDVKSRTFGNKPLSRWEAPSDPFTSKSETTDKYKKHPALPECPSNKIVGSNFAGYRVIDDYNSGHRFLEKIESRESKSNGSLNITSPLPPIQSRQSNGSISPLSAQTRQSNKDISRLQSPANESRPQSLKSNGYRSPSVEMSISY